MNTEELTEQELELLLQKKREQKRKDREHKKKAYESNRDVAVSTLMAEATQLHKLLKEFKGKVKETMTKQHAALADHGGIRANSLGGFTITHGNNELRVRQYRDTEPNWDERAGKAVELLKDFLGDAVKKRDKDMYDILMSFLERNQKGDLEYSKVFQLIQHREKYQDERWVKGLELLEESFSNHLKGFGYVFQVKDEHDKWQSLSLNFSSL